jgi:hypothetical protein
MPPPNATLPLVMPLRFRSDTVPGKDGRGLAPALESMARDALTNCAPTLLVPPPSPVSRKEGGGLRKSQLSLSIRRRIKFLDRRDRAWHAVSRYFLPIQDTVDAHAPRTGAVQTIAFSFYLLVLSTRASAQVRLPLAHVLRLIEELTAFDSWLSAENRARIALVHGVFASLRASSTLPCLALPAGDGFKFADRLEEILEDAYLTEASQLRRFLGYEANASAIRRNLRSVLRAFTRERRWARGVTAVAEQVLVLPKTALQPINRALEALGEAGSREGPLIVDTSSALAYSHDDWFVEVRQLDPLLDAQTVCVHLGNGDFLVPVYFGKLGPDERTDVVSFSIQREDGSALWRVESDIPRVLDEVRYGVVPPGFVQTIPSSSGAPPILDFSEKLIAATGHRSRDSVRKG